MRQALDGNNEAAGETVRRLSPWLISLIRVRMNVSSRTPPEDILADVWLKTLPKLTGLEKRGREETRVLLAYLSATVHRTMIDLTRQEVRSLMVGQEPPSTGPLNDAPATSTGVVSRAMRLEEAEELWKAIATFDRVEQDIVISRIVEGASLDEIGVRLNMLPNTVSKKWQRALNTLRTSVGERLRDLHL